MSEIKKMADAPDPDEILRSTLSGKENFQRVTRLLVSGGASLLREIFDSICHFQEIFLRFLALQQQRESSKLHTSPYHSGTVLIPP